MEISWSNKFAAVNIFRLSLGFSSGKFLAIMGPEIFCVIIMVCAETFFGDLPLPQTIKKHNQTSIIKHNQASSNPKEIWDFLKTSQKNKFLCHTFRKKIRFYCQPLRIAHFWATLQKNSSVGGGGGAY